MKYKYIFVILVYRNTVDLIDCLDSICENVSDYKVIVVNSYYDDASKIKFSQIADEYNCDFLNVENKGYGAGNNRGIELAIKKYDFRYLVVSNPDIVIETFAEYYLDTNDKCVIAPLIRSAKGKAQNPYWMFKNSFTEWLIYKGQKHSNTVLYYSGIVINKIARELGLKKFLWSKKRNINIYAAHGSFIIFPKSVFSKIETLYDEEMFLFAEEVYLAHKFENLSISTVLTKDIEIIHKEDGSITVSRINENSETRKSVIYYYEKLQSSNKDRIN